MSESVEIDHVKLKAAYDGLTSLVSSAKSAATTASNGTPIGLPSLEGAEFTGLMSWFEDQKPELKTRLDLAILLDTKGTGSVKYEVNGDTLDNTKALLGNALADRGSGLRAMGDPKFIREYNDILAAYTKDGKVMSPMFQKLGPEGTLKVLANIGQANVPPMKEDIDAKRRLMDLYREGLGSASKESGFPSEDFAKGLVKAATKDPEDYVGRGTTGYGLTSALSVLMYNAHFSDGLSTGLANELDKYERVDHHGIKNLWGDRPDSPGSFLWDQMLPYEAGTAAKDPMISMNSMLHNAPHAALDFYSDNAKAQYYIHDRTWNGDRYLSLSQALDAATTDPELIKDPVQSKRAAELASATINLLGTRDNKDDLAGIMSGGDGAKNFAHILGTYMVGADWSANHEIHVDASKDPGKASDLTLDAFGNVANVPLFDKEALAKFGIVAMSSDDGMAEMRNSSNRYESMKMSGIADLIKHPRVGADGKMIDGKDALHTALGEQAHMEGMFLHAVGDAAVAEGKEKDEQIGKWIDHAESIVGLIPVPGVENMADGTAKDIVNLAIDEGKSSGVDSLKESLAHYEKDARSGANKTTETALHQQEYVVARTLLEQEVIKPDGLKGTPLWKDGEMISYEDFSKLSEEDQNSALSTLMSSQKGVGQYFDQNEYEDQARNEFSEFF
jgi:hypothetical protein